MRTDKYWLELTDRALNIQKVFDWLIQPNCGAINLFAGLTRDHSELINNVKKLEYEAYETYVEQSFLEIFDQMFVKWPMIGKLAIVHRAGIVEVGEVSVVVGVSTPHRKESFEAVQFGIDTLKIKSPIWKTEIT